MKWKDRINKRYLHWLLFIAAAATVIEIVGQLGNHFSEIVSVLVVGLNWILRVAKPVIFGFVMAYILKPLNNFFTRQYAKPKFLRKKSRVLGVITVLLLLILTIAALISAIVYSVTNQLQLANVDEFFDALSSLAASANEFYVSLTEKLSSLDLHSEQVAGYVGTLSQSVLGFVQQIFSGVIGSLSNISGFVTTFLFGIIIGIYFMLDGESIVAYFSSAAEAIFKERTNRVCRSVLHDLDEVFSGYIRGQLLDVGFMMLSTTIAMMCTGISLAPIIGLLTGLGNLVPYLGPIVGYVCIIAVSVVEGKYKIMIASIIALCIIQILDGNIIEAKLLGRSIQVHALLVVVLLIFGSAIGGLIGMLLAVPVGAFFQKRFAAFVERKKAAKLAEGQTDSGENE